MVGLRGVRWGVSDFLQIALHEALECIMVLPPCLHIGLI